MKYVIVLECSGGNDSVGNMWLDTLICNHQTTIKEIIKWKKTRPGNKGRLMITEESHIEGSNVIKID